MNKPSETDRRLRNSILDILCYYSVFKVALTDQQILSLLSTRASMVGVRSHLRMLQKRGKITQLKSNLYSIKKLKYSPQSTIANHQQKVLAELKKNIRLIKLLPFIKSISITSDSLLDKKANKLPRLVIVCSPNRIYVVMSILFGISRLLDTLHIKNKRYFIDPLPMFFTTAGFSFVDQIGYDELSRVQWFVYSKPIYGELVWDATLRKNGFISKSLPNFTWKKQETKYITSYSQILDSYDNKKYRQWLRKMAQNDDYKKETALLRVRPDTFIARENHYTQLDNVKEQLGKNREVL